MEKIHTPAFMRAARCRRDAAAQAHMFASADPVTQLAGIKSMESPNPLQVHLPAVLSQGHVDL